MAKKKVEEVTTGLRNRDLYELMGSLDAVRQLKGIRFAYAVSKNISKLKQELHSFEEMSKPDEAYNKYDNDRIELAKKFADKDEKGEAKSENGHFVMSDENRKEFDEEVDKLMKSDTHKQAIEDRKKQLDDFKAFLEEQSDFEPFLVKMEYVPEDISADQLAGIFIIIDDAGYKQ